MSAQETKDKQDEAPQGDGPQRSGPEHPGFGAVSRAARDAANGDPTRLTQDEESSALDWLLGAPEAPHYHVDAQLDTPAGLKPMRVYFAGLDGKVIDRIEQSHISKETGVMNKGAADTELCIEAIERIEDPRTGRQTVPRSDEFRTLKPGDPPLASPIDAWEVRLGKQPGLTAGIARTIREAAGWVPDRVGQASRVLVDAAGN